MNLVGDAAKFDAEGNLLNREELLDKYASDIAKYNQVETIIQDYDNAKEKVDDYTEAVRESILNEKDLTSEKIEYTFEYSIEINEQALEKLEWHLERLEN